MASNIRTESVEDTIIIYDDGNISSTQPNEETSPRSSFKRRRTVQGRFQKENALGEREQSMPQLNATPARRREEVSFSTPLTRLRSRTMVMDNSVQDQENTVMQDNGGRLTSSKGSDQSVSSPGLTRYSSHPVREKNAGAVRGWRQYGFGRGK